MSHLGRAPLGRGCRLIALDQLTSLRCHPWSSDQEEQQHCLEEIMPEVKGRFVCIYFSCIGYLNGRDPHVVLKRGWCVIINRVKIQSQTRLRNLAKPIFVG